MRLFEWLKRQTRPGTEQDRAASLDGLSRDQLISKILNLESVAIKLRAERAELQAKAEAAQRSEQVWRAALDGVYQLEKRRNAELIFAQEAAARGFKSIVEADKPPPK